jgi:hypothetical protein
MNPFNRAVQRLADEYANYDGDTRRDLFNLAVQHFVDTTGEDTTCSDDLQYDGGDHDFADNIAATRDGHEWYRDTPDARDWIAEAMSNFGDGALYDYSTGGWQGQESRRDLVADPIGRIMELGVYMEASAAWYEVARFADDLAAEIADEVEAA